MQSVPITTNVVSSNHVLDTTLCDKVYLWLATGRWFSLGSPGFLHQLKWWSTPISQTLNHQISRISPLTVNQGKNKIKKLTFLGSSINLSPVNMVPSRIVSLIITPGWDSFDSCEPPSGMKLNSKSPFSSSSSQP